jgi:hypothetical protein
MRVGSSVKIIKIFLIDFLYRELCKFTRVLGLVILKPCPTRGSLTYNENQMTHIRDTASQRVKTRDVSKSHCIFNFNYQKRFPNLAALGY